MQLSSNSAFATYICSSGSQGSHRLTQGIISQPEAPLTVKPADNKAVFTGQEFGQWAFREGIEPGEQMLIEKYLASEKSVLDAGTGGGRLAQYLRQLGFKDLHGFDYVPSMIEAAKKRPGAEVLDFQVQDAVRLTYPDAAFDQVMYLQQLLCVIPDLDARRSAMREALRVLRPGGVAVFSFLSYRARSSSWTYKPFLWWLRSLRLLRGSRRGLQYQPWLRLNNSWNPTALWDRGPYIYWYKEREACDELVAAGFHVVAVGSDAQVAAGRLFDHVEDLVTAPFAGRLYVVCRK